MTATNFSLVATALTANTVAKTSLAGLRIAGDLVNATYYASWAFSVLAKDGAKTFLRGGKNMTDATFKGARAVSAHAKPVVVGLCSGAYNMTAAASTSVGVAASLAYTQIRLCISSCWLRMHACMYACMFEP